MCGCGAICSAYGSLVMSQLTSSRVLMPLHLYAIKSLYLCTFRSARSQAKSPSEELDPNQ